MYAEQAAKAIAPGVRGDVANFSTAALAPDLAMILCPSTGTAVSGSPAISRNIFAHIC